MAFKAMTSLIECLDQMLKVRIRLCEIQTEDWGIKAFIILNKLNINYCINVSKTSP